VEGAGRGGDALVHERAAEIVGADIEQHLGARQAFFDPRGLEVAEARADHQAADRHEAGDLVAGRPLAYVGQHLFERERRFGVHEGERHELGEAAGLFLHRAQEVDVPDALLVGLDVAVHDRRGSRDAERVRCRNHLDPLGGGDAAAGQALAHAIVEDLGGGARDRAEAERLELFEVRAHRHAEQLGAVLHFLGRERVHMDRGRCGLHCGEQVQVQALVGPRR
jgi:hypothetical protein